MIESKLMSNFGDSYKSTEEEEKLNIINDIGCLQFVIYDPVEQKSFSYDLSHPSYEGNAHIRRTLSELFIMRVSGGLGWSNPNIQSLSGRAGTVKSHVSSFRRLGAWWAKEKPNKKLSDWVLDDVKTLIENVLELKVDWQAENNQGRYQVKREGFANRGVVENIIICLNESEKFYLMGKIQDGLCFRVSEKQQKNIIRPILKCSQITYEEWKKGESWPSIPLPVAMLLLNDAIEIVRDKKTKFLIEYFQFQRSEMYYTLNSIFLDNYFQRFCDGLWNFENARYSTSLKKAEALLSIIHKHYGSSCNYFPMTHEEIRSWCIKVYQSALVIMLALTGARISELASMKAGDLTYNLDGLWDFKSEIIKTNYGLSTIRAVHGLAAEAVYALEELSYIPKSSQNEDVDIFLFGKFFTKGVKGKSFMLESWKQGVTKSTLSIMLKDFYSEFLIRHPEIKAIWSNIHPHQFRHTFAEFALRRFDGNVHEYIRRHFRHSHGSFMTNVYLSNKVNEAFIYAQEVMIQEIAEQMINDASGFFNKMTTDSRFHGAAMKAALELLDATVINSEEELHNLFEEFADEFEKIVPHEYGYCMPRTKTITQSQCFDKVSKVAKFEEAGFSTCSSCVHLVQEINSHEASIVQIGWTHAQQMRSIEATTNFGLDNNKPYQASKSAVIRANQNLKRMNSDKTIASPKE